MGHSVDCNMAGLNLNIGSSVVKREAKPKNEVVSQLTSEGWEITGEIGPLTYLERSKINITVMKGALGTVIFPSGPIRGRLFGDSGFEFNQESVIGLNATESDVQENRDQTVKSRTNKIT